MTHEIKILNAKTINYKTVKMCIEANENRNWGRTCARIQHFITQFTNTQKLIWNFKIALKLQSSWHFYGLANGWTNKRTKTKAWTNCGYQETGAHVTCIHIKMKLYTVFIERNILKINCLRWVNVCKMHVCECESVDASVLLLLFRSIRLLFISEAEESSNGYGSGSDSSSWSLP